MTWKVESTIIDEYVPAARDAWSVVNELGEVADDSVFEEFEDAQAMADDLNSDEERVSACRCGSS